jgi:hypothetical protein
MTRKTESLSYPKNPLVALRELQELNDLPPVANGNDPTSNGIAESLPRSSATSSATANATGSDDSSATSSATRKRKQTTRTKEDAPLDDVAETGDPLAAAVRKMLSRPYTADPRKGPFTVSTVKIPTEISERLGWVATLTGKAKQEILADALKDYFAKVLKEV